MSCVLSGIYTIDEIRNAIGGGNMQSYLPQKDGAILCGMFDCMNTSALKSFAPTVRRQLFMPVNNQKFTGTLGLRAGLTTTDGD